MLFSTSIPSRDTFSALDEHQQFTIISSALVCLNTDIALYISKYIFNEITYESNKLIDLFSPTSPIEILQDYHEMGFVITDGCSCNELLTFKMVSVPVISLKMLSHGLLII